MNPAHAQAGGRGWIPSAFRRLLLGVLIAGAVFMFGGGDAFAQELDRVQVEGNQRIEDETVRSYMSLRQGDVITEAKIDRSLKALFATGLFSDVTIRRAGNDLVVNVVENPIINRLAFEGNNRIDDDALSAEVQLRPRQVYSRARIQSDVQRIIDIYRRAGRFSVSVEPKVVQLPQNRVDLIFEVEEGPVTGIRKITFIGNRHFSDRKLRSEIATKEDRFYRLFTSADKYDPDRLGVDRELLRRLYLKNGFIDFRVVSAVAELSTDRKDFFVTITVDEGERFRVGETDVRSAIRDLEESRLMELVVLKTGKIYNAEDVAETIQDIAFEAGRVGFAFVDIRPDLSINRDTRIIDVTFVVNEAQRIFVERINITGNSRTLDKVIRREFRLVEGDAFNAALLQRSRQRIRALGFFETVEMTQDPGSQPDKTVINVNVREQSTGELSFGAGFSSDQGVLADIGIRERNLLGRGQDLRASITLSGRTQEIDLSFTEPFFLDRNLAAGFDLFRKSADLQRESSFESRSIGFSLRAGFPITEFLRQSVNYTLRSDTIGNIDPSASRFVRGQEGTSVTSAIGYILTLDTRNDRISPTEGFIVRLEQTLAGLGGNKHFLRSRLAYAAFFPLAENWTVSLRFVDGFIVGLGEDISISDRFFVGGNDFRGFRSGGIGPRDTASGDALGGNLFYVGTAELTFPVGLPSEIGLLGRVFSQAGSLARVDESGPGLSDVGSVRVTAGFGVSWSSPFGPIQVDWATAIKKEDFDETQAIFLSFGTRF